MNRSNFYFRFRFLIKAATSFVAALILSPANLGWALTPPKKSDAVEVTKFPNVVWAFDFLDDNNILLTTRDGTLHHLNLPTGKKRILKAKPEVVAKGQGGLLDLRILKDGPNTWVFLTASVRPSKGTDKEKRSHTTTALLRGEWRGTNQDGDLEKTERIFEAVPSVDSSLHFGSRLALHKDGSIFMTLGERNERDRAQKLDQHWGKVLRLRKDGTPFQSTSPVKGALAEVYTYGHRNPQGIAIHPDTDDVFVCEHGPRGGDEINVLKAGANYGWPLVTFGREYWGPKISEKTEMDGVESPIKYYVPSIAPGSMIILSGAKESHQRGQFLLGALALQHLNLVPMVIKNGRWTAGEEKRYFNHLNERIRSVGQSPNGELFFGTDSGRFMQFRL